MISAIILTLNEERNIVDCIRTLKPWCAEIVVFDSCSSDRTVELARQEGARVYQRKFDNYAAQRNAALHEVEYRTEWAVMVDADERWDRQLGEQLLQLIAAPECREVSLIFLRRKDIFLGRWLKHNIGSGTWFGRVLRPDRVTVERDINEVFNTPDRTLFHRGPRFLHYPFSNGVNWWFFRHNRYSDMEAVRLSAERGEKLQWSLFRSADPAARRQLCKQLLYRLPGRPLLMFFALYFIKFGFLDGKAGFHYSVLRSIYEYMIDLKTMEHREQRHDIR